MNNDIVIHTTPKLSRASAPTATRNALAMADEAKRLAHEYVTGVKLPPDLTADEFKSLTEEQLAYRHALHLFKTCDPETAQMKELASLYATGDEPVLIMGDSGSGKELIARILHGVRDPKRFVAINCAGFNDELLGNELFGHEGGAYTGALAKGKTGKVEMARGGTLFLDEIGDMKLTQQAHLLRLLESRTYYPVGGTEEKKAECRFVFATNIDLAKAVKDKRFREDLYYRISALELRIKPLAERMGDVRLIAETFVNLNDDKHRPLTEEEILEIPYDQGGVRGILNWLTRRRYRQKLELSQLLTDDAI